MRIIRAEPELRSRPASRVHPPRELERGGARKVFVNRAQTRRDSCDNPSTISARQESARSRAELRTMARWLFDCQPVCGHKWRVGLATDANEPGRMTSMST